MGKKKIPGTVFVLLANIRKPVYNKEDEHFIHGRKHVHGRQELDVCKLVTSLIIYSLLGIQR